MIRDLKIDLMLGNPNEIIDEFIRITDGIQIMNVPVYEKHEQEFIWYVGEKWLFYQDLKNGWFWCNYKEYWSIFESKFGLKYSDIQSITKFMVETAFKNVVGTPVRGDSLTGSWVETAFKNVVGTPRLTAAHAQNQVETAFKNVVGTPAGTDTYTVTLVETAFKNGVGTPSKTGRIIGVKVETAFKNVIGSSITK